MRYVIFGIVALLACDGPTETRSIKVPTFADGSQVVHPAIVRVTVTPGDTSAYPSGTVQYVATARDGQGSPASSSCVEVDYVGYHHPDRIPHGIGSGS